MTFVSVFDMYSIGVGPSSSHTVGPWRIVQRFLHELRKHDLLPGVRRLRFDLLGSLALTGKGHATDSAVALALLGHDPETVDVSAIDRYLRDLHHGGVLEIDGFSLPFDPTRDIRFLTSERHPAHANVIRCLAFGPDDREQLAREYMSLGGGFIARVDDPEKNDFPDRPAPPYPVTRGEDLGRYCREQAARVSDVVRANEAAWFSDADLMPMAKRIWDAMRQSIVRGCQTEGVLPGGLDVQRRAPALIRELVPHFGDDPDATLTQTVRAANLDFEAKLRVISCFAIAVNEENAALGRVVTAPTNGAAGVIPAALMYRNCFAAEKLSDDEILRFFLVSGQIGALFKQNATISAAMGGCQAEIGVSSAMAAAGLAELMGGSAGQTLMAAEIAMEHHLGMTCDPVGGLVQVPCIERNAMGVLKAISAAVLATESDPARARVSLDQVIDAMWDTAQQMNERYKETSLGGLAVKLSVRIPEC